jgi:predicted metal-dependent hydrolase
MIRVKPLNPNRPAAHLCRMRSTDSATIPETHPLPLALALALPSPAQVRWRRSARARRVTLRIDARSASVVVTLPARAARRQGIALLSVHAAWVAERLAALAPHLPFVPGAEVPLGGAPHVVRHAPAATGPAWLEAGAIVVAGTEAAVAGRVGEFLQAEARRRITTLSHGHAARLGVKLRGIRLKDTRSRWGSCAPDGTLAFSWRLVMAPDWVLDYVVAHEVAHLRELNHSDRFWALVAGLTPHRDAAVAWLKAHGPGLLRVG